MASPFGADALLPLALLFGLGFGAALPLLNALMHHHSPPEDRGENINLMMLTLNRGGPVIWLSEDDAKKAGIPLLLIDRNVDQTLAKGGEDYVAFIGSDFVKEGLMAAEVLTKAMGGNAKIIELQGTVGSSPANDRMQGFADYIKDHPGMQIIASQSGDFARDKGRQVFETLYQAHPEATALYSHNDEMTMGAIAAMEAAGKVPGKDLIIASIDGTKDATQALIDGKILVVIECNPKFGPAAFDAIEKMGNGETLATRLVNIDRVFTKENAAEYMPEAY